MKPVATQFYSRGFGSFQLTIIYTIQPIQYTASQLYNIFSLTEKISITIAFFRSILSLLGRSAPFKQKIDSFCPAVPQHSSLRALASLRKKQAVTCKFQLYLILLMTQASLREKRQEVTTTASAKAQAGISRTRVRFNPADLKPAKIARATVAWLIQ